MPDQAGSAAPAENKLLSFYAKRSNNIASPANLPAAIQNHTGRFHLSGSSELMGCKLGGAYLVAVVMKSLLFEVTPTDPVSIGAVSAVLLLAALFARYVPARSATRVDPILALRKE